MAEVSIYSIVATETKTTRALRWRRHWASILADTTFLHPWRITTITILLKQGRVRDYVQTRQARGSREASRGDIRRDVNVIEERTGKKCEFSVLTMDAPCWPACSSWLTSCRCHELLAPTSSEAKMPLVQPTWLCNADAASHEFRAEHMSFELSVKHLKRCAEKVSLGSCMLPRNCASITFVD